MEASERKMRRLVRRYNAMRALALLGWFLFLVMLVWQQFTPGRSQAVAIEVNGQPVVWLKNERAAARALDLVLNRQRGSLPGEAMLRPDDITQAQGVLPEGEELASVEEAAQALEEAGVTVVVQGWAFRVGDNTVAVMDSQENAESIKEGLIKEYVEGDLVGEVEFEPPVSIDQTMVSPDQIETDIAAAMGKVTKAHEGFITYTIKSGDDPSGIAQKHGISLTKLTERNPWLQQRLRDNKYIFPGEKLEVPQETQGLTVIWQKRVTEERETPFPEVQIKSPEVPPGQKQILTPGKKGLKKVTALQTFRNKKMVDEKIETEDPIRNPVTQKVKVHGTPS